MAKIMSKLIGLAFGAMAFLLALRDGEVHDQWKTVLAGVPAQDAWPCD